MVVTPADAAEISVIIVNYNTADLALEAVESVLARHHDGRRVDVHLVDNASPKGDATPLAQAIAARGWQGRVTLYAETENHGFGRGNNLVLRALAARPVPPRYVMLLNPDAQLRDETIGGLAEFLDAHPKAAVAGCGINRPDGTPVPAVFRFPNLAGEFAAGLSFGPVDRLLANRLVACPPDQPTGRVDWVSGAALMARLEALHSVDFFDPDYFLYFEETDLMHRLARAGYETWHVAGLSVVHEAGAATGMQGGRHKARALPGYWYDGWQMYFRKNHGRFYATATALSRLVGWAMNQILSRLRGRTPGGAAHFSRDFSRHVLRPLLGWPARQTQNP